MILFSQLWVTFSPTMHDAYPLSYGKGRGPDPVLPSSKGIKQLTCTLNTHFKNSLSFFFLLDAYGCRPQS